MKDFMRAAGQFVRVVLGVLFALTALGGVIASIRDPVPENIVGAVFCATIAILLLRKKKGPKQATVMEPEPVAQNFVKVTTTVSAPDVPEDILRDMRKYYTVMQAQNDARIMSESFRLAQQTTNMNTFLSRLELARKNALTLLQAEKAGCKGIRELRVTDACNEVLARASDEKAAFLRRAYITETNAALLLKTQNGQRKRLEAYLRELEKHEDDFMDVAGEFSNTVKQVQVLLP
jgi:hypothetical protein